MGYRNERLFIAIGEMIIARTAYQGSLGSQNSCSRFTLPIIPNSVETRPKAVTVNVRLQKHLFRLIPKIAINRIRFGTVISAVSCAKVYA